jgi:hypothetical protein
LLVSGGVISVLRKKNILSVMQLVGAACLLVVVLAHLCEAYHLLPSMGFGKENSVGHYLDMASAIVGFSLFPLGYLLAAVKRQSM